MEHPGLVGVPEGMGLVTGKVEVVCCIAVVVVSVACLWDAGSLEREVAIVGHPAAENETEDVEDAVQVLELELKKSASRIVPSDEGWTS